ncbi:MAG: hypothetical protein A2268_01985 [Candidatus Raymondbacteria bacterium RifOxyA12_full_50_37]|uniref:Sigma-54-dependent Fis family transcriptional regulator n=1 Tax=Candidatus Raymondbacteria bacterium RIFOXYD12_FULL_49_13 TaxID=1817890 RepID=A0A1F7F616_UNCRA|nr:MAG: hypothetical protein A2268_01985 [Candidatus Raymondbacteria bacterium RifOxyA12_full_50_37]OGJ92113.1 MAG: hypothetical protein A2248_10815 [Candidatus Raymondbacteria bacterium RIFOXYA2_FULL_49_16]OGJ98469.1 MAG: hypothetical protein A2453_07055 [Candidatus Raymondbacteria bacterium RIFOXYC2_FULL_50_21]OGK02023.1 MAG: hypothetical protein A2519_17580 [Candidatus Raymondbacteria bacterium RIFOXYD12_FULL_49_13]OGP44171.1 MAG: hypothetical protein A2324_06740 [Candidatus Raymondbacteria 
MACLKDKNSSAVYLLHRITTIGSSADNNIRLRSESVRSEHARITFEKNRFFIEVCANDCALSLNGKNVRRVEFSEGDVLDIGDCSFVFTLFADARASGKEESQAGALESMRAFSNALMTAANLDMLLEQLIDHIIAITHADRAFLVLKEEGCFSIKTARNIAGSELAQADQISDSMVREIAATKKPLLISDAPQDTHLGRSQSIIDLKLRSIMGVPLVLGNELLGVICVGSEKMSNLFDEEDLAVVSVFAAQASLMLKNLMLVSGLKDENEHLKTLVGNDVVYKDTSMENVMRMIRKAAPSDMALLVLGETGTGKELAARQIHAMSSRKDQPFITVNCSAIPESLVESELFGHKKGSFTSAFSDRKGKFEAADKGTIFLDEIGDMPAAAQSKLLRVLETGEIEMVGDTVVRKVDVRVIAATNKDLKAGNFREDLYFRLAGLEIRLPALRDRGLDSLYIARSLLEKINAGRKQPMHYSKEAESAILKYPWPGNVRELKNRILRAATLCPGQDITDKDLELGEGAETAILPLSEAKERFTKNYISEVLALNNGNKTKAAQDLGIDPRTIYRYVD